MVYDDNHNIIRTHLQREAEKVRELKPNWTSFVKSKMISQSDYEFILTYQEAENKMERDVVLNAYKDKAIYALIHLMSQISNEEYVRYILTVIDDLLREDIMRIELFEITAQLLKRTPFSFFLGFLHRPDQYTMHLAGIILTRVGCFGNTRLSGDELDYFTGFLREQMNRGTSNDYIATTARCMQTLFKFDVYRMSFANHNGFESLIHGLYSTRKYGFQLQYQIIFCMWLLTFNPHAAELTLHSNIIPTIVSILGTCQKEKVIRIVVATLSNIVLKIDDSLLKKQACLQMIQCRLAKKLEHLQTRKFDDIELVDDITFLNDELNKTVQILTSFDEYDSEVRLGSLHWSPVHKCEKFWLENAQKLNENRFELLKILIGLLGDSTDPLVLCVAVNDIGEYVRYYPRGKYMIEQLGGKEAIMRLLSVKDPNVRYHALLCAQKLMIHNWKYLGLED